MPTSNSFWRNILNGSSHWLGKHFHNPYKKAGISPMFIKYLKHIPPGKLHNHKLFGYQTWFSNGQEYLHGIKEIFIEEIYKQTLPENAYIIDCGANIGLSIIYLKRICPTAQITAFEPDKKNFALLEMNIKSRQLKNVELKNQAVWKETTLLNFESEGTMSSKINLEKKDNSNLVEAVRLKDYLNRKIDFLKLDIEGAEFEVLVDLKEYLSNVNNLFVEYHGSFAQNNELTKLFTIFTETGFHYYIKEATVVYHTPFMKNKSSGIYYDVQLNIFCFRSLINSKN
ncbi:MAG: FkbM family methyltransferase [Chitinophagales bacterium]